jgi:hypothetical protein
MVLRTVREVVTGYIIIETCGSRHSHNQGDEQFQRGLSNAVKESINEITKFNIRIKRKALQRALITPPLSFPTSAIDINKITSYLHNIRRATAPSYNEHTVSGLWNVVSRRQFDEDSSDWAKVFFTLSADEAIVDAGSNEARVHISRRRERC